MTVLFTVKSETYFKYLDELRKTMRPFFQTRFSNYSLWDSSIPEEKSVYKSKKIHEFFKTGAFESDYATIPATILVVNALRYLIKVYFYRFILTLFTRKPVPLDGPTIVTFFPNIDRKAAETGKFRSNYWGGLHDQIEKSGKKINWVLLYSFSEQYSFLDALTLSRKFNSKSESERFFLLENFLTFGVFARVLSSWVSFVLKSRKLEKHPLANEIRNSLFGPVAIENLLWSEVFENMARELPAKDCTLYTSEGQPWERTLVTALKRASRTNIYAYHFFPLRTYDFRFFYSADQLKNATYLPSKVLVISKHCKKMLADSGYPDAQIEVIESLRYGYLKALKDTKRHAVPSDSRTLLVICGYMQSEVREELSALKSVLNSPIMAKYSKILIKPHPFAPVQKIMDDLGLVSPKIEITTSPLGNLWNLTDVALCSHSTSALLESLWIGIPTFAVNPENEFNLSSLLESNPEIFVNGTEELAKKLETPVAAVLKDEIFEFDQSSFLNSLLR